MAFSSSQFKRGKENPCI